MEGAVWPYTEPGKRSTQSSDLFWAVLRLWKVTHAPTNKVRNQNCEGGDYI